MQSHIRKVYACLAVTCHLRFWQNERGLLRATAVTRCACVRVRVRARARVCVRSRVCVCVWGGGGAFIELSIIVGVVFHCKALTAVESAQNKSNIIIIIDRFYIALFSALEQTQCARM